MNRNVRGVDVELLGLAVVAALFALLAPAFTATVLFATALYFVLTREISRPPTLDFTTLAPLAGVALGACAFGASGAVGTALIWRSATEIARSRETQGLSEPFWLAVAYRWAPLAAALLFRLGAPATATLAVAGFACIALGDWTLRRLAEWRLGEPQPFDTASYLGAQVRVLAMVLLIPDAFASLAAFAALTLARALEAPRMTTPRYATAP